MVVTESSDRVQTVFLTFQNELIALNWIALHWIKWNWKMRCNWFFWFSFQLVFDHADMMIHLMTLYYNVVVDFGWFFVGCIFFLIDFPWLFLCRLLLMQVRWYNRWLMFGSVLLVLVLYTHYNKPTTRKEKERKKERKKDKKKSLQAAIALIKVDRFWLATTQGTFLFLH